MNKISFPFSPIIQDENQATFCKMFDKSDSLVNLEMTAVQIWCQWRAFIAFPGTILGDSYFGQIKILDCQINDQFKTLKDLEKDLDLQTDLLTDLTVSQTNLENNLNNKVNNLNENSTQKLINSPNLKNVLLNQKPQTEKTEKTENRITKITQKHSWIQVKITKQNITFLICKDQTLLQITKIGLVDGKKIDFSGYNFP